MRDKQKKIRLLLYLWLGFMGVYLVGKGIMILKMCIRDRNFPVFPL